MKWMLLLIILNSVGYAQTESVKWRKNLLDHYKETLPRSYINKLRKINVVDRGQYNQLGYEQLLNDLIDPKTIGADPVPGAIQCIEESYSSLSISDFQDLVHTIARYVAENSKKIKCEANKETMTLAELMTINSKLRKNKSFNNDWPGGNCYDRAYLISYELDKLGFKSSQLLINDYVVATYRRGKGYIAESYPEHIANIVKVSVDGKIVDYVLDPIYFDEPVPLSKYKELTLVNKDSKFNRVMPQDFTIDDRAEPDQECFYTEYYLQEAQVSISRSQDQKPKLSVTKPREKQSRAQASSEYKAKYFNNVTTEN